MSSNSISNNPSKLTYDPPSWKQCIDLIGASPYKYCKTTAPVECKKEVPEFAQKCSDIFKECIQDAKLFEIWHRMN